MDYVPHASEIFLIAAVIFLIFGLGRLPQMSVALARTFGGTEKDKASVAEVDGTEDRNGDA